MSRARDKVNEGIDSTLHKLRGDEKPAVSTSPPLTAPAQTSPAASALTSIPGLRPASLNGEQVSELHLRAARAAHGFGKSIAPTVAPVIKPLADKIEAYRESVPVTSGFSDPGLVAPRNPEILQRKIDSDRAAAGVGPYKSPQQLNQEAIDAARYAQRLIETQQLRERLRAGN